MLWILILLPLLCGLLVFMCFRSKKAAHRFVLILSALACAFVLYASTNPIPGSEGPGLLAIMFVMLALGSALGLFLGRVLPRPQLRSPSAIMNLWLLGAFLSCPFVCYAAIICCGTNFEGAAYSVLVTAPLLYGSLGWLMPKQAHPKSRLTAILLLLGWTLIPAGLFYFLATHKSVLSTIVSFLFLPNREMAPVIFSSLFYTPQSAFGLEVLRPFAISSTQLILTVAFGVGMVIRRNSK